MVLHWRKTAEPPVRPLSPPARLQTVSMCAATSDGSHLNQDPSCLLSTPRTAAQTGRVASSRPEGRPVKQDLSALFAAGAHTRLRPTGSFLSVAWRP